MPRIAKRKPAEFFALTFGGSRALGGGKAYSCWDCAIFLVHKSTAVVRAMWIDFRSMRATPSRASDCAFESRDDDDLQARVEL
jgi:hypothetical protein